MIQQGINNDQTMPLGDSTKYQQCSSTKQCPSMMDQHPKQSKNNVLRIKQSIYKD